MCGRFFLFKQKTAYGMRMGDWSSDVCSPDLTGLVLVFALIAASPVLPGQDVSTPVALAASTPAVELNAGLQESNKAIEARVREIEARARQLESELDASASLGDTIASAEIGRAHV